MYLHVVKHLFIIIPSNIDTWIMLSMTHDVTIINFYFFLICFLFTLLFNCYCFVFVSSGSLHLFISLYFFLFPLFIFYCFNSFVFFFLFSFNLFFNVRLFFLLPFFFLPIIFSSAWQICDGERMQMIGQKCHYVT